MEVTLDIDDNELLESIERLRGQLTPAEFVRKCVADGLRSADAENRGKDVSSSDPETQEKGMGGVFLGIVSKELAKLDRRVVFEAVKEAAEKSKASTNPINEEVKRLVRNYTAMIDQHCKKTGRPVKTVEGVSLAPIQQIALEIALHAFGIGDGTIRPLTKH